MRIQRHVQSRLARQSVLDRDIRIEFVVDEAALRRRYGGRPGIADILRHQLDHLRHLARRPAVTIQVLPFHHGPHLGMNGAFSILEFDADEDADVLHVDNGRPNILVRKTEQIAAYKAAFRELQRSASLPDEIDSVLAEVTRDSAAREEGQGGPPSTTSVPRAVVAAGTVSGRLNGSRPGCGPTAHPKTRSTHAEK